MAWALVGEDNWGVTARMAVDFRKPVTVGLPIRAEGWITHARRRVVDTAGHIVDATTGVELATADRCLRRGQRGPETRAPGSIRLPPDRRPGDGRGHSRRDRPARHGGRPLLVIDTRFAAKPPTHAVAFVAAHRDAAEALGTDLAEFTNDPDGFAAALTKGLAALADPAYLDGQQRVAPGIGQVHGVRWPLMAAVQRGFRNATRGERPTPLLFIADRLFHETELEARWFAFGLLERTLDVETERTWQLLRRAAREAGDWITVDSLAHPYAKGSPPSPIGGPSWSCSSAARPAGSVASSARRSRR